MLITDKSVFYHIQRTGGMFVNTMLRRAVVRSSNTKVQKYLESEEDEATNLRRYFAHVFHLRREHATQWELAKEQRDGLFSFAFVREPLAWYKSFWAFRKPGYDVGNFSPAFPLDFAFDTDFEKFIANVINMYPLGFVTTLYKCFLGENGDMLDFVGKQENLREDLIKALTLAGEEFDEEMIMDSKAKNVHASSRKFTENVEISKRLDRVLRKREHWVLETFY